MKLVGSGMDMYITKRLTALASYFVNLSLKIPFYRSQWKSQPLWILGSDDDVSIVSTDHVCFALEQILRQHKFVHCVHTWYCLVMLIPALHKCNLLLNYQTLVVFLFVLRLNTVVCQQQHPFAITHDWNWWSEGVNQSSVTITSHHVLNAAPSETWCN